MKSIRKLVIGTLSLVSCAMSARAYPVIDQAVPSYGLPVKVYPDHQNPNVYWYIPISIDPWSRDNRYKSTFYKEDDLLVFVFRGQPSVDQETLNQVARAIGTSPRNLTPIAYDYSKNLVCQEIFADSGISWQFPKMIGNYLEIVPVTISTQDPRMVRVLSKLLEPGQNGLACTVEVGFKATTTAYKLSLRADLDSIYNRFEANAHGEFLWWEADIRTLIESLIRDRTITITSLEDTSISQTELDKKVNAAMDDIIKQITAAMFQPALKLPDGPMAGRGKAWSLRTDFRHSHEHQSYSATLNSQKVVLKDTQISLHLAIQ